MKRLPIAVALGLVVAACAPGSTVAPADQAPTSNADRPCFLPQSVVSFAADDDNTAYVRAGRNEVFELRSGFCRGLRSARSLSVGGALGTGGRACTGQSIDIAVSGPSLSGENDSRCRATVTRRLSEAEVEALGPRLNP